MCKLADDKESAIFMQQMLPGQWRLSVGNFLWINTCYCYHSEREAAEALLAWNGTVEPEGWYRCPTDGRRRPDCTKESEYVYY